MASMEWFGSLFEILVVEVAFRPTLRMLKSGIHRLVSALEGRSFSLNLVSS